MKVVCSDCHGMGVEPGTRNDDCAECQGTGFFTFNQNHSDGSGRRFMSKVKHRIANRRRNGARLRHSLWTERRDS